jgi:hypothetical protein
MSLLVNVIGEQSDENGIKRLPIEPEFGDFFRRDHEAEHGL